MAWYDHIGTDKLDEAWGVGSGFLADPLGIDPLGNKSSVQAAEQQYAAQQEALAQQERLAREAQQLFREQSEKGIGYIGEYGERGAGEIRTGGEAAQGYLGHGLGSATGAIGAGTTSALGALGAGYGQARSDVGQLQALQGFAGQATGRIGTYDVAGQQPNRLSSMLDQPGGLYGGFQEDPGYQFRQQQGEQAINRAASARGGRLSGRTLQEISGFNQGLASQEFGNYSSRQQAAAGIAAGADQQRLSALISQAGREDAAGLAAQGNAMGLAGMGYGAQSTLAQLAASQGGAEAGIYGQQGQSLADLYGQFSGQQAGIAAGTGSQLGNLYAGMGENMGNVAIGVGGNAQANAQNLMGAYQNFAQYGGMTQQAQANASRDRTNAAIGIIGAFSDRRLKTDIEVVPWSKYERIGLRGVRWRWNGKAAELGLRGDADGVIAQDVVRLYPHAVGVRGGFLAVDYAELDRMIQGAA